MILFRKTQSCKLMTIQFYHIISKIKKKKKKQILLTADAVNATEESWLWLNVLIQSFSLFS